MTPILETPRLILRPVVLADAARTQFLFPHWEIVRYLAAVVPWPFPPDGAHVYYRDTLLPAVARGDEWAWTIRLKASPGEHIGAISLSRGEEDNRGFWLGLPWQRQGFMSEAVTTINGFWFNALRFEILHTPKAAANTASRRISLATGMRLTRTFEKAFCRRHPPRRTVGDKPRAVERTSTRALSQSYVSKVAQACMDRFAVPRRSVCAPKTSA